MGDVKIYGNAKVEGRGLQQDKYEQESQGVRIGGKVELGGNVLVKDCAFISGDVKLFTGCVRGFAEISHQSHVRTYTSEGGSVWTVYRSQASRRGEYAVSVTKRQELEMEMLHPNDAQWKRNLQRLPKPVQVLCGEVL